MILKQKVFKIVFYPSILMVLALCINIILSKYLSDKFCLLFFTYFLFLHRECIIHIYVAIVFVSKDYLRSVKTPP